MFWHIFKLRMNMGSIVQNNISFYGNMSDIIELEKFLSYDDDEIYNKILPIPNDILDHSLKEINEWRYKNWGALWIRKGSVDKVHMDNYSIYRIDFLSSHQPPCGILNEIYKQFNNLKSVNLAKFDSYFDNLVVVRRDPLRGFQKCISYYPYGSDESDERDESSEELPSPIFDVLDEFILDLSLNQDLSHASEMIGVTLKKIQEKIIN
jgi:hypothetical protein